MPPLDPTDEAFLRCALERWLLTPAEVEECRRLCRELRAHAADVVRDRRLLDPQDVAALQEWMRAHGAPVPAAPLAINRRYTVQALLAEGGMGRVYLVDDGVSGRTLALKTLRKERSVRSAEERFAEEFKILAAMHHPNVQAVYDYGTVEEGPAAELGSLYFTCERIEGLDLLRATEGKPWREALPMLVQLCRGLQFLHARGLMHLDVKPENVLVRAGAAEPVVTLVDFGLAQPVDEGAGLEMRGTLAYLSPEMIRGEPVDHRADLYGLGITIWQVLARRLPFPGANPRAVLQAHLEAPAPSLRTLIPDLPEALDEQVRALLAKAPGDRPSGAGEAIRRLSQAAGVAFEAETKGTLQGYVSSGGFVGRAEELAWLRAGWERVVAGEPGPRFLVVSGEMGIGKSRLVREFRIWAQTTGVVVAEGRAEDAVRRPFGLFQEALDRLVRQVEVWERVGQAPAGTVAAYAPHLRDVLPALERSWPGPDPEPLDDEAARVRLLDKTSEFVLRAVEGTALLLVLEDVHWADEASADLAEFLARKAAATGGKARLLVVATLRHGDLPPEVARAVERLSRAGLAQERRLRALPREDQAELVRSMFGDDARALLEQALTAEESGNPHFLKEVLREWVDEEVLLRRPWGWEVDRERAAGRPVPRGVREILARRLERTGERERRWLGRLAVWGLEAREPDFWVLGMVGSPALADLVRRGLLREEARPDGSRWRFAHAHVAETARAAMGEEEWKRTSAEFLRSIEGSVASGKRSPAEEADRLARLAWDAGDPTAFRRWGEEAARQAERRHALGEARDLWGRLLETETEPDRRTALRERVGDLRAALGDLGAADACYREALSEVAHRGLVASEAPPTPGLQTALTRLLRKLAQVAQAAGRPADAEAWYEQALREIRAGEAGSGADGDAGEGGGGAEAGAAAGRVGAPGGANPERLREEARVLTARARFEGEAKGDVAAGERLALEALTAATACGEEGAEEVHAARLVLGLMRQARGDAAGAQEHFAAAETFWRRRGNRVGAAAAAAHAGEALLQVGDRDAALQAFARCLAISEEVGDRRSAARAWGLIGLAHRKRGDATRALDALARQAAIAEDVGWALGIASAHADSARVLLAEADKAGDGAAELWERGMRHLRQAAERYDAAGAAREAEKARAEVVRRSGGGGAGGGA